MNQPVQVGDDCGGFWGGYVRDARFARRFAFRRHDGGGGGGGRERGEQLPPGAARREVDEVDDAPDAFRNRSLFQIEKMRTRHGDVRHRFVDLEKLQPARGELLAEHGRDLDRKPLLILPALA